jgi:hypothetical protein
MRAPFSRRVHAVSVWRGTCPASQMGSISSNAASPSPPSSQPDYGHARDGAGDQADGDRHLSNIPLVPFADPDMISPGGERPDHDRRVRRTAQVGESDNPPRLHSAMDRADDRPHNCRDGQEQRHSLKRRRRGAEQGDNERYKEQRPQRELKRLASDGIASATPTARPRLAASIVCHRCFRRREPLFVFIPAIENAWRRQYQH